MLIKANPDISRSGMDIVDHFDIDIFDDRVAIQGMADGIMIGNTFEIDYACLDLIVSRLRQEGKL